MPDTPLLMPLMLIIADVFFFRFSPFRFAFRHSFIIFADFRRRLISLDFLPPPRYYF